MNREEVRKLVGGYATGTLTEAERKLLFEAALDDQDLFDELAEEDALKEIIEAPGVRSRLATALAPPPKPRKSWALRWIWAEGAALAAGVVVAVIMMRNPGPLQVAEVRQQVDKAAPVSDAPTPVETGADRAPQPAAKSEVASNAVRDIKERESDRRADDSERRKVAEPVRAEPASPPPPLPVKTAPPPVQVQPPPAAKDAAPEQPKQEQARPAPAKELTVQLEAGAVQQGQGAQNQAGRSTDAVAQQSQAGQGPAPQQSTTLARDQAPGTQQGGGGGKQSTQGFVGGALAGARGKAAAPAALAKVAVPPTIAFRYIPMDTGVRITPAVDGFLQQAGSAARAVRAGVPIDIPFPQGANSVVVTFAIRQPGVPAQKTDAPSPTRARTDTVAFPTGTDSVTIELGAR